MGRCQYVYTRGRFAGTQCEKDAGDDMFCKFCSKKKSAQKQAEDQTKPWKTREECLEEPGEEALDEIIVSEVECNYFVLDTGYTSRLIDNGDLRDWLATVNEIEDEETGEIGDSGEVEFLFAEDDIWGEGFYKVSKDEKEVNRLVRILKAAGKYKYGLACFRGQLSHCFDIANTVEYCGMYNLMNITTVACGEVKIAICEYDCESG